MKTDKYDFRKFRCGKGKCTASLPEVYCQKVKIFRREIQYFVELLALLGDAVLSYHILQPKRNQNIENPEMDTTCVFIWVDPQKHHDPEYLVQAAGNIACGSFTLKEEKDFITNQHSNEGFLENAREVNCPTCIKNHLHECRRAMTYKQYRKGLAETAGIHD